MIIRIGGAVQKELIILICILTSSIWENKDLSSQIYLYDFQMWWDHYSDSFFYIGGDTCDQYWKNILDNTPEDNTSVCKHWMKHNNLQSRCNYCLSFAYRCITLHGLLRYICRPWSRIIISRIFFEYSTIFIWKYRQTTTFFLLCRFSMNILLDTNIFILNVAWTQNFSWFLFIFILFGILFFSNNSRHFER